MTFGGASGAAKRCPGVTDSLTHGTSDCVTRGLGVARAHRHRSRTAAHGSTLCGHTYHGSILTMAILTMALQLTAAHGCLSVHSRAKLVGDEDEASVPPTNATVRGTYTGGWHV